MAVYLPAGLSGSVQAPPWNGEEQERADSQLSLLQTAGLVHSLWLMGQNRQQISVSGILLKVLRRQHKGGSGQGQQEMSVQEHWVLFPTLLHIIFIFSISDQLNLTSHRTHSPWWACMLPHLYSPASTEQKTAWFLFYNESLSLFYS